MLRSRTRTVVIAAALAALCGTTALASNSSNPLTLPAGAPAEVKMTVDGAVLFTPAGMSLYVNSGENTKSERFRWTCTTAVNNKTDDEQSGIGPRPNIGHTLIRSCLDKFRPYAAEAGAKPVGDFGIVARPDGTKQWTFRGMALYLSMKDRAPGERNGPAGGGFAAGVGGRGGAGITSAAIPMRLPTGLRFARRAEGIVLETTVDGRAVYTPRGGARVFQASVGREDFKPIAAPAVATVNGDWSLVDSGMGFKQYAFRGKLLYAAPTSLNELEVAGARNWEPVVMLKAPPVPAAIGEHLALTGHVYTTRKGMSLYTYNCNAGGRGRSEAMGVTCDDPGDPAAFMVALCGDGKECARRWKPYIAAPGAKPEGEFSLVDITYPMFNDMRGKLYPEDAPKVKAWAYRGKPLFTYYEDEKPGDMWGSNTGGIWGSSFTVLSVPGKGATFFEP